MFRGVGRQNVLQSKNYVRSVATIISSTSHYRKRDLSSSQKLIDLRIGSDVSLIKRLGKLFLVYKAFTTYLGADNG